jgi:integrase
MASVRKQTTAAGSTFYQAIWSVRVDGKRRQNSKSFEKKSDARQFAAQMEDQAERQGISDPNRYTVRRYFEVWIEKHPKRASLSPTTIVGYRRNLAFLSRHIGDIELSKLSARDLDQAYGDLLARGGRSRDGKGGVRPLAARTVLHVHRAAYTALKQAVKWSLIPRNPATNATAPTPRKSKARALRNDEWQLLWSAAQKARYPGMDALVATLAAAGLRRSELLGLAWDAVDLDTGTISIRRTVVPDADGGPIIREIMKTDDSERVIAVPASLVALLRRHRAFTFEQAMAFGADYQRSPLFCFPEAGGFPMRPDALTTKLRSLMRSAGVRGVQPAHGYRHSMATNALANGVDLKTVSTRMGHSRTSTTIDLYVHGTQERDRAAGDTLANVLGI